MLQSCGMPPSVYLLREKPPLVPSSQGASALKFYILFFCYLEELGSPFPGTSDPQY